MTKVKVSTEPKEFTAPDGGWGWMVVLGAGLSSMVLISIVQTSGLIYKDRFEQLQFSVTDTTSIMSINSSFGMILGILNGPLLKKFGYRKVALVGGVLFVSGLYYTAFAESYIQFLVSYGMISSIGTSMSMSALSLALNTYFKLKRSLASSFSITIMGMGPIVLPLLITQLLFSYGWRWTVLIIAALTMNTFVGALLLQPIKWHVKGPKGEDVEHADSIMEKIPQTADTNSLFGYGTSFIDPAEILGRSQSELSVRKWLSQSSLQKSKLSFYQEIPKAKTDQGNDSKLGKQRSVTSLDNEDYGDMMRSTLYILENTTPKDKPMKYASVETLDQKTLTSSPYESEKLLSRTLDLKYMAADVSAIKGDKDCGLTNGDAKPRETAGIFAKIGKFIRNMYDLDLLLDPIYINLLIGLSIATVGEIIFSLLTPFIITELGLTLDETALFMSVTAVTDVVFRFLSPFFGQLCKFNSRIMYVISISILLITRASLLFAVTFTGFMAVAVFLGVGKGFRTVYWTLVVPDYVPLNKLASASAFQSLSNGISLLISGPVIGAIISRNDNKYINVIFAANCLTFTTILLWSIEFIVVYQKNKRRKSLPS